jgi:hypothetical protein
MVRVPQLFTHIIRRGKSGKRAHGVFRHESPGDLSGALSIDCVVTRKSPASHLQSIFLLFDPPFNADVSATKSREKGEVMKKNLAGIGASMSIAVMTLVMATAIPMFAQNAGQMKVTVPFNFVVENERMQAGDYTIERIASGRLRIHSSDGRVSTTFIALAAQGSNTPEKAHFIFHRYGGEYFLAKIWTPGQNAGWEVLQGRLESELAKNKMARVETATLVGR